MEAKLSSICKERIIDLEHRVSRLGIVGKAYYELAQIKLKRHQTQISIAKTQNLLLHATLDTLREKDRIARRNASDLVNLQKTAASVRIDFDHQRGLFFKKQAKLELQITGTHLAELQCAAVLDPNTPIDVRVWQLEHRLVLLQDKLYAIQVLVKQYEAALLPLREEWTLYNSKLAALQSHVNKKNQECEVLIHTHHDATRARDAAKVELEELLQYLFGQYGKKVQSMIPTDLRTCVLRAIKEIKIVMSVGSMREMYHEYIIQEKQSTYLESIYDEMKRMLVLMKDHQDYPILLKKRSRTSRSSRSRRRSSAADVARIVDGSAMMVRRQSAMSATILKGAYPLIQILEGTQQLVDRLHSGQAGLIDTTFFAKEILDHCEEKLILIIQALYRVLKRKNREELKKAGLEAMEASQQWRNEEAEVLKRRQAAEDARRKFIERGNNRVAAGSGTRTEVTSGNREGEMAIGPLPELDRMAKSSLGPQPGHGCQGGGLPDGLETPEDKFGLHDSKLTSNAAAALATLQSSAGAVVFTPRTSTSSQPQTSKQKESKPTLIFLPQVTADTTRGAQGSQSQIQSENMESPAAGSEVSAPWPSTSASTSTSALMVAHAPSAHAGGPQVTICRTILSSPMTGLVLAPDTSPLASESTITSESISGASRAASSIEEALGSHQTSPPSSSPLLSIAAVAATPTDQITSRSLSSTENIQLKRTGEMFTTRSTDVAPPLSSTQRGPSDAEQIQVSLTLESRVHVESIGSGHEGDISSSPAAGWSSSTSASASRSGAGSPTSSESGSVFSRKQDRTLRASKIVVAPRLSSTPLSPPLLVDGTEPSSIGQPSAFPTMETGEGAFQEDTMTDETKGERKGEQSTSETKMGMDDVTSLSSTVPSTLSEEKEQLSHTSETSPPSTPSLNLSSVAKPTATDTLLEPSLRVSLVPTSSQNDATLDSGEQQRQEVVRLSIQEQPKASISRPLSPAVTEHQIPSPPRLSLPSGDALKQRAALAEAMLPRSPSGAPIASGAHIPPAQDVSNDRTSDGIRSKRTGLWSPNLPRSPSGAPVATAVMFPLGSLGHSAHTSNKSPPGSVRGESALQPSSSTAVASPTLSSSPPLPEISRSVPSSPSPALHPSSLQTSSSSPSSLSPSDFSWSPNPPSPNPGPSSPTTAESPPPVPSILESSLPGFSPSTGEPPSPQLVSDPGGEDLSMPSGMASSPAPSPSPGLMSRPVLPDPQLDVSESTAFPEAPRNTPTRSSPSGQEEVESAVTGPTDEIRETVATSAAPTPATISGDLMISAPENEKEAIGSQIPEG